MLIEISRSQQILLAVVLGVYLLALLLLSVVATKKVETEEDYLVAGRRLPLFLAWGTLIATWFGAASMMGAAEAAREKGLLGVTLDPFACSATLILAGLLFAKPLWRMKLLTMGDYYRRIYGTKAEILGCCIQTVGYFGWIAAQYVALAGVLQAYFGIDPFKGGILVAAGVTLFYTMIGGMWSVTLTDTAQIVVAFVGLLALAYSTFSLLGGGSLLTGLDRFLTETPPDAFALVPPAGTAAAYMAWGGAWATGLLGNIPGQDLQQRVFASKDEKTASRACILAGISYFAFGMIPVSLGILSNITDPGDQGGKILALLAGKYLSPTMSVVFIVSFVSIVVSTATSAVLAPATILAHNIFGRLNIARGHRLLIDRGSVLLCGVGGIALAYSGDRIMHLLDISLSMALVGLLVPMLMGLYGKPRGELPAVLSMALGASGYLVRFFFEELIVPMSHEAELAGLDYAEFIRNQFPAERVGQFGSDILYWFATLPDDLIGLSLSIAGYFLGQWILARRGCTWTPPQLEPETRSH